MRKLYILDFLIGMILITMSINAYAVTPKISAGYYHSSVLNADGMLFAWGDNSNGQLGDRSMVNRNNAVSVLNQTNGIVGGIFGVSSGYYHTIAIKSDGSLLTWGWNGGGQLGDGTTSDRSLPVPVVDAFGFDITGVQDVVAGYTHTIALKNDGTLLAWGMNGRQGRLGDGTTLQRNSPINVCDAAGDPLTGIMAITTGGYHNLALKNDGTLLSWGDNRSGKLGDGTSIDRFNPVFVRDVAGNPVSNIQSIAAGWGHSIALKQNGTLLAWGWNQFGQLGDGTNVDKPSPVVVRDAGGQVLTNIAAIAAGDSHTIAMKNDGTLLAWGWNQHGQLGDGNIINQSAPTTVTYADGRLVRGIVAIAAGFDFSVALRNDGVLLTWGDNSKGQLGDGSLIAKANPNIVVGSVANTISLAGEGAPSDINVNLNAVELSTGGTLVVRAQLTGRVSVINADLYYGLQLPDGTLLIMQPDGSLSRSIIPFQSDITVPDVRTALFNYTLTGVEPTGTYTWLAALMEPGTLNVIGQMASATFTITAPPPPAVTLTGNWTGRWSSASPLGRSGALNIGLTQLGLALSGSGSAAGTAIGTAQGTVSGTKSGNNVSMGFVLSNGQSIQYTGTVNAAGTSMSGNYNFAATGDSGTWSVSKQ